MQKTFNIIIDFDSTFIQVEALEELAYIALEGRANREVMLRDIKEITDQGMEGKITFSDSLAKRMDVFSVKSEHVQKLIKLLKHKITPSIEKNKDFFLKNYKHIYIISGGFKEYIIPIVAKFGIPKDHVFANDFVYNNSGNIIGPNFDNHLAHKGGKVKQVKMLNLSGAIHMIGDGYTDYQVKEAGVVTEFIAFIENVERFVVTDKADHVIKNFDEYLELLETGNL